MAFHLWMIGIIASPITILVLVYLWTNEMRSSARKLRETRKTKEQK